MANELIDGLAPSASSELKAYLKDCQNISKAIEKINANPINVGGSKSGNNRAIIAEIEQLNQSLSNQQGQIQRLTETRQRSNRQTQEEITNNAILAQNARQSALANSQLAGAYRNLQAQQAISARRVQDLIARGRLATQTQKEYDAELRVAQREFDRLNQRVVAANRAIGRFGDNVGNYPKLAGGVRDLIAAFGIVGGVTLFASLAKDIFNTTRELQGLDLALKNVTGSQEVYGQTQEFLSRISESYGIEINGLTKSYTGFLAASQNSISQGLITAEEIQQIFESVSKASGAMGLSVEQQQGAFLALQQMISKGNVQAEEIRGQLAERLPGAFGILAKSMGVTEQQLNELLKDGKVLAAEVLPAFARELERAYGVENLERVESLAASTTRLGNAWTDLVRSFSDGEGVFSRVLISIIEGISGATKGLELFFSTAENKSKYQSNIIFNKTLKTQLEYYRQLGEEQGKTQAQYDSTQLNERIQLLEAEGSALRANIKAAKEQAESIKPTTFEYLTNQTSDYYVQLQRSITKMTSSLSDNTKSIALNKAMLKAATQVLNQDNEAKKQSVGLSEKELKRLAKLREEELQNQYRLRKLRLESEARTFEGIMKDASLYYAKREEAANDLTNKEIALAELTRKENLRRAGKNQTLQLIAWEEYYKDYEAIVKDSEERVKNLKEKSFEEFQQWAEKYQGEGLRVIDTTDLRDDFFKKRDEDAKQLKETMKELRKETDAYLASFREDFFSNAGFSSLNKFFDEVTYKVDDGYGNLVEVTTSSFDKMLSGAENFQEQFSIYFNSIAEVAQEAFAFVNQTQEAYFQSQYARIEKERDLALKYAGESESGKAEIQKQYEERRRQIRRRELQQEKEAAIFNATIDTAQGVVASLAKGGPAGIALAAVIAALGAAQIALIASQPIPAYKHGTDNHKGGLALVGDGGKHEVVYQPSLGWSITPNKDTLVNLEKGSKVFPDLASSGIFNSSLPDMIQLNGGGLTAREMDNIMRKNNRNKPVAPVVNIYNNDISNILSAVRSKPGKA